MIELICKELSKQIKDLHIQRITQNDESILIYLSDLYGNNLDMLPLCFDKNGNEMNIDIDYDPSGVDLDIPEKYDTFRNRVYDRLVEVTSPEIINNLGPYGISFPLNALYTEYIDDLELSQLFAICNYLVNMISLTCSEQEKSKFVELLKNEVIDNFIKSSNVEKLDIVTNYYFVPNYIQNVIMLSQEILDMAMNKSYGKHIDLEQYHRIKSQIKDEIIEARKLLSCETDEMCNVGFLGKSIDELEREVGIELSYCEEVSSVSSKRMKEKNERATDGTEKMFGIKDVKFDIPMTFGRKD